MIGKKLLRALAALLTATYLLSVPFNCFAENVKQSYNTQSSQTDGNASSELMYIDYIKEYSEAKEPEAEIAVFSGKTVLNEEKATVLKGDFNIKQSGLYAVEITYRVNEIQSEKPLIRLEVNGSLPFYEASQIGLPQLFKETEEIKKGDIEIPESQLINEYQTRFLYDTLGYYGGLLKIYFKEGKNTLEISSVKGDIEISSVSLKKYVDAPYYNEVKENLKGEKYSGENIKFQAENIYKKSDSTIYAINDRSSAFVEPTSAYERWLNAIGGTNWQTLGQFIEWDFYVPEDGLYSICLKYRKETKSGLGSNRRIYIDGKIPYKELEAYTFDYSGTYVNEILSSDSGEEMLFELSEGKHTIRLEVAIGDYSSILPKIYAATQSLQRCYRQFIMVMGTAPDSLRDYELEKLIPEVLEEMSEQKMILESSLKELEKLSGGSSSGTKLIMSLVEQIEYFEKDSYYIAGDIQSFKTNIASVVTWVLDVKVQPLKLDYIAVCSPSREPKAEGKKLDSLLHSLKSFLFTFSRDYEYANLDTDDPETLTVWDPSGATEFSIWRQLVQVDFAEKNPDIKVNFKNVSTGFQQAFLAGMLPDVYVGMTAQDLMEFAFRKCIVTDISEVAKSAGDNLEEELKNYDDDLYYPVTWEGRMYGFPMAINVPAVYYRTDILSEMELKAPDTWDDIIYLSSMLQKKNLEVGMLPAIGHWTNMIYQKGGKRFDEERTKTYLTSDIAIDTFSTYTSLYTEYSVPVSFSALDRFRTGEMPIVFGELAFINSLDVLAPEISGKWDFTHYPGTVREDGSVDYSIVGGSATYMIITNRRPEMAEKAWEFIKWRGSTDTLVSINRRLEMSIGRSVRAVSPNSEAQKQIPWSSKAQKLYDFYEDWRVSEPEVPGNYFVTRAYTNAWTAVYYQDSAPGDALKLYIPAANAEIIRRREYFGMDTPSERGDD